MTTSTSNGLSNAQQAYLMLAAFLLPSLGAWLTLGAPDTHTAFAMLGASFVSGIIAFIKEYQG
jgi:uncharacterized membrane protein YqaE (UPF0057 family)